MREFVEMKVAELKGAALDWAVQVAVWHLAGHVRDDNRFGLLEGAMAVAREKAYSTNWASGGALLDEHGIEFKWLTDATIGAYSYTLSEKTATGGGHLEAACRLIAMELGDAVQVPVELVCS